MTKFDLGLIKETLGELKCEIDLEKQRTPFNPQKIEACSWIFSSTDYAFFQGSLYKKLPSRFPGEDGSALSYYKKWMYHGLADTNCSDLALEDTSRSGTDKDYSLYGIGTQIIPPPQENESIVVYLNKLHEKIYAQRKWKQQESISLKSFVNFLREHSTVAGSFLDVLFPSGMEFSEQAGIITSPHGPQRLLNLFEASKILQTLVDMLFTKRSNAQFLIAQVLGLCWLCLTKSRILHPSSIKDIHAIPVSSLWRKKSDMLEDIYPGITIPTLRGEFSLSISEHLFKYLNQLAQLNPNSKIIFQSSLRALRTSFSSALKNLSDDFQKVTFLSFLYFDYEEVCSYDYNTYLFDNQNPKNYPSRYYDTI